MVEQWPLVTFDLVFSVGVFVGQKPNWPLSE